jgi:hypothetical protein
LTRWSGGWALALAEIALLVGCAGHPVTARSASKSAGDTKAETPPQPLQILLSHPPDLVLTLHPPALLRDNVYGPLVRRASELAAAYAGPTNLGTTALAVLERTDEVVVAENERGKEAVVVLRGVPADLDPLQVVDMSGRPIWRSVAGDVRTVTKELSPSEPSDAALFIAPGLVWVIASGPAIPRTRAALMGDVGHGAFAGDDTVLASLSLPGDALPQLHRGALANVGAGLLHLKVELTSGAAGLVLGTLAYADAVTAASAEGTVLAVTLAFRHRLEEGVQAAEGPKGEQISVEEARRAQRPAANLEWLGAAKVDRVDANVIVRAPIPRPWLEALAKAELTAPAL